MAAVLACGPDAVLSHRSAAALWGFAKEHPDYVEVSVRRSSEARRRGIRCHRRPALPLTKHMVNKFEVDFFWPELGLVVETDGWRYHRTPSAQSRDALRFQTHIAAGFTPLRFSHYQVKYEPRHVREILTKTAANLRGVF